METIHRQLQEFEHLGSASEANSTALLFDGESGYPDGNETALPEGQTEIGMSNDFEEELAILPAMNQLGRRRATQGDTAEDEGPCLITDLLPAFFSLLSDERDRVEVVELVFADSRREVRGRKRCLDRFGEGNVDAEALPTQNLRGRLETAVIWAPNSIRLVIRDDSGAFTGYGAHRTHPAMPGRFRTRAGPTARMPSSKT